MGGLLEFLRTQRTIVENPLVAVFLSIFMWTGEPTGASLTHLHLLSTGLLHPAVAFITADPILSLGWVILTTVAARIFQA